MAFTSALMPMVVPTPDYNTAMNQFTLPTGRIVEKDATHCVAVQSRGRWSHKFFKSYKGAMNEIKSLRAMSDDTKAYYDVTSFRLIKPNS
jgi:hypothetical protein